MIYWIRKSAIHASVYTFRLELYVPYTLLLSPSLTVWGSYAVRNRQPVVSFFSFDLYEIIKEASFVRHTAKTVIGMFLALWVFSPFFLYRVNVLPLLLSTVKRMSQRTGQKTSLCIHKALMTSRFFFAFLFSSRENMNEIDEIHVEQNNLWQRINL